MSLFVIADLHLPLGCNKPMDIFRGWDNYVDRLEKNWRRDVCDSDIVVIPGDISWAMKLEETENDLAFINSLPGTKVIMKGNHDYWWNSVSKMEKFMSDRGYDSIKIVHNNCFKYGDIGICGTRGWINEKGQQADKKILLREAQRLSVSIECALKQELSPLVFLHYPPVYNSDRNEEILAVLKKYDIKVCFYGHIHGSGAKYAVNGEYDGIYYKLIASDYLQFAPLCIDEFVHSDNLNRQVWKL